MERLTLYKRPNEGDKVECLPAGDGLPVWPHIPLDAKLPMMKNPKGAVTLYTTTLGRPKHIFKQVVDFDLRDPHGYYMIKEYHPLHDPHLKSHFNSQAMRRVLIKKGFITEDGKVICSLREFNQYRRYLRHMFFLEIAKKRKEELHRIYKQRLSRSQRDYEVYDSLSHGTVVRRRLKQQQEEELNRLKDALMSKSEKFEQRLQRIREDVAKQEQKRREDEEKKWQGVHKYQQQTIQQRQLAKKKIGSEDHLRRQMMERRETQKKLKAELDCIQKWNARKAAQQETLAQDEASVRKEDRERRKNIDRHKRFVAEQRRMQRNKLEKTRERMQTQKEREDERKAKILEKKLASYRYRIWTKRKVSEKPDRCRGKIMSSNWKLEDVLNNLMFEKSQKEKRGSSLMVMINDAIDSGTTDEEEQELAELQAKAKEIVQGVFTKVETEIWPRYINMMVNEDEEEEEEAAQKKMEEGEKEALKSHSVRFCPEEDQIDQGGEEDELSADHPCLKPVSEHVLTPCASQLEIQRLEAEAILGTPAIGDKLTSASFVETLLLRLLDDLNGGRLTNEDIMKLASYSMDILQSSATQDTTILEAPEEGEPDGLPADSSSTSVIAKKMVDFTLQKILSDIQLGKVHPDELASLTVSLLDDEASVSSSASISICEADLDSFIDDTMKAATVSAMDRREDTPLCEALLDDFMINTLQNLIHDIDDETLSKSQIEALAMSVKDEANHIISSEELSDLNALSLQETLTNLLAQLQDQKIDIQTMYQIVFAVVYAYNMIKAPSTPCFENRITTLMRELLNIAEEKAASGHIKDVNINIVREANQRLSHTNLNVGQIERMSSSIISTVSKSDVVCRTATSDIARAIVEDCLKRAKQELENENADSILAQGIENVAEAVIATTSGIDNAELLRNEVVPITFFEVVKNLRSAVKTLDLIDQTDLDDLEELIAHVLNAKIGTEQLEEMAVSFTRVLNSPKKSESTVAACLIVANTLKAVNEDLQKGAVEDSILREMLEIVSTTFRATRAADPHSPSMLNALSSFLKTVLLNVSNKVQMGDFDENDIRELTKAMRDNIVQNKFLLSLKETVFDPAIHSPEHALTDKLQTEKDIENVLQYIQELLEKVEAGQVPSDLLAILGEKLVHFGKNVLENYVPPSDSDVDVLASDIVEKLLIDFESEMAKGSLSHDSIKEITKAIISSASSVSRLADDVVKNTISSICRDVERGHDPTELHSLPPVDKSPSASTVASNIVLETIEAIVTSNAMVDDNLLMSVASSVIPMISEDLGKSIDIPQELERLRPTIQAIINCLKADSIDTVDAERIFAMILQNLMQCSDGKMMVPNESLSDTTKMLVNDLVTETLNNIERSAQKGNLKCSTQFAPTGSDATSVVVDDLVEKCLKAISKDLGEDVVSVPRPRCKDISDFIHDIVSKLQFELSEGTISNLSMAHFFQAISSGQSDLQTLEANAYENLTAVIQDIHMNGINSIYVHRILETYLSTEQSQDSMFSDPVKAVESILISVSSDILTKFVKATLQNILIELKTVSHAAEHPAPAVSIHSAASLIAENVIREVVIRVKLDINKSGHKIHDKVNKHEIERVASRLVCESPMKGQLKQNAQNKPVIEKASTRSKDVEDIVLENLHNIVSNLRLEQSMQSNKASTPKDEKSSHASDEVQDFVLDTLQNIITDLQDRRSQLDPYVPKTQSKTSTIELVSEESREAAAYVKDVFQTVLRDMKHGEPLPVESLILDSLQNATSDGCENDDAELELTSEQREKVRQILLESLRATFKNIQRNRVSSDDMLSLHLLLIKYMETPKGDVENDLKSHTEECLVKILDMVENMELDDYTLNRISTQLATIGTGISSSEKGSPEQVASNASVASSLIEDLVKETIHKISDQIENDPNQAQEKTEDTNVNFNKKMSASSVVTNSITTSSSKKTDVNSDMNDSASSARAHSAKTHLKGKGSASSRRINSSKSKNHDRKSSAKNKNSVPVPKIIIPQKVKQAAEKLLPVKKSPASSLSRQNAYVLFNSSAPRAKSANKLDQSAVPQKQRKEWNSGAKPQSPLPTTAPAKQTKSYPVPKSQGPGNRGSISSKQGKSEPAVKKQSSPAATDLKKAKQTSSKKKKKERTPKPKDPSVVKSICGAHHTKIKIREDEN